MDRLEERVQQAGQALASFERVLAMPMDEVVRDSAILRFAYTFECVWKAAQQYLAKWESVEAASPTAVVRACWKAGMLDEAEAEASAVMARDRNLTVHTYNEALARELCARLAGHARLLRTWLERLVPGAGRSEGVG